MSETVFVKLTEDEIKERGKKLADKLSSLSSLKLNKKEMMKELGDEIKALELQIFELAETIRSSQEERPADELPGVMSGAYKDLRQVK